MIQTKAHRRQPARRVVGLPVILTAIFACDTTDRVSPSGETAAYPELAAAAVAPGIMFASSGLTPAQFDSVHTGTVSGVSPTNILSYLSQVRAKRARVILRLHADPAVRNADNTFNLTKWKSQIARFRTINFRSYITDGTIVAHHLIDEPHFPSRWGGKTIPQATVEAMAQYSKQLYDSLITVTAAPPTWLDDSGITYRYLDAAWSTYFSNMGSDYKRWAATQVNAAKSKGLGLVGGLNVLDGGNGSSGFRGNLPNRWAMSASELRSYGSAILAQTHVCAFVMWKYTSTYYGRSDIKSAMRELSTKAKNHPRTSCRQ
jgi:hypothetical protein